MVNSFLKNGNLIHCNVELFYDIVYNCKGSCDETEWY